MSGVVSDARRMPAAALAATWTAKPAAPSLRPSEVASARSSAMKRTVPCSCVVFSPRSQAARTALNRA
jgi:hypothetical protein